MHPSSESSQHAQSPRYDCSKSYRWNYDHAPSLDKHRDERMSVDLEVPGEWKFLDIPVASPLGIAAGPLLNGDWCLYYGDLGFDVLTYKTVRSGQRDCYPLPNLQPVACDQMTGAECRVAPSDTMQGSWAVSFGMPSSEPEQWRRDIERTRDQLSPRQVLSVSVVGTVQPGWDLERLAVDYADCARWAVESGADCIEANFSCPNVSTCDGQLYQDAEQSRLVASTIRAAIGNRPLIIKIGYWPPHCSVEPLIRALSADVDGLSMTNSIAAKVGISDNNMLFEGQQRGICGEAIREQSIDQVSRFADEIRRQGCNLQLIGVGGIRSGDHVRSYLDAGAHACHLATAVMIDPEVGLAIRRNLSA